MNDEPFNLYLDMAYQWAALSHAKRRKVGCVIVLNSGVMTAGYNAMPQGYSEVCEDEYNSTLPHVIHAEAQCLHNLLVQGLSVKGAYVFCTDSPCIFCAVQLANCKIDAFYYHREYRLTDGLDHLKKCNIPIIRMDYGSLSHTNPGLDQQENGSGPGSIIP